jgi:hypothetical protein
MPTSPNVLNYFIGKGTVSFTPTGGAARDLGNAPSFSLGPTIETLEHFSSRSGIRSKDRTVTLSRGGVINMILDEITLENLQLALFGGAIDDGTVGDREFSLLGASEITGSITLTGTNDVGNQFTVIVDSVTFTPTGEFDFISDEFGQIELTGEVLEVDGSFGRVIEAQVAA